MCMLEVLRESASTAQPLFRPGKRIFLAEGRIRTGYNSHANRFRAADSLSMDRQRRVRMNRQRSLLVARFAVHGRAGCVIGMPAIVVALPMAEIRAVSRPLGTD